MTADFIFDMLPIIPAHLYIQIILLCFLVPSRHFLKVVNFQLFIGSFHQFSRHKYDQQRLTDGSDRLNQFICECYGYFMNEEEMLPLQRNLKNLNGQNQQKDQRMSKNNCLWKDTKQILQIGNSKGHMCKNTFQTNIYAVFSEFLEIVKKTHVHMNDTSNATDT